MRCWANGSVQAQLEDMALVRTQVALLHPLDDVGQRGVRRRGHADLLALVDDEAVEELDLGAAALDHVLAHRRTMLAAAGLVDLGQALGYRLEEIHHVDPEMIARAGEGDLKAKATYDAHRLAEAHKPGGGAHRPSMGQDMVKGRRTEIEFLNGFIVDKGKEVGVSTPANAALTHIVKRVEKGDLQPDKRHILELRLN